MSRARVHEVSSPISLFPFIGILLCTMGALLVILVAVSKSAKNTAVREVQSQKKPTQYSTWNINNICWRFWVVVRH